MQEERELTGQQAFQKLSALCARSEHCQQDMLDRMRRWNISDEEQAAVMQRLIDGRYVDDERFARAFVRDKLVYNKWGRRKIEQALWQKRIAEDIQRSVLDEIEEEEYLDILRPLLVQKRRQLGAYSDYEQRQRLLRFALSRGFTMEETMKLLDHEL